ncbi:MAG TPA: glycosyltransferase family A protein [Pyrinomonadaceae bacterium]|nr:glycosyltransferase family A protein [Pyrinomonadaceae bacterium]
MSNGQQGDENMILSTIIRFHERERLPFLENAVSSLSTQDWPALEVVVMLQNPDEALPREVEQLILRQPWHAPPRFQVIPVGVPAGVDGRSELLNRGITGAAGRFIAFLDDDDIIYPHGYRTLVEQLLAGDGVVAVGGYCKAYLRREADGWRVVGRENAVVPAPSRLTLFRYNYVPIHSYVIDRSRLGSFELYFDNDFPPLEDYDFLLRLFAVFEPDFSQFETQVCEYRIHELNSVGYSLDKPDEQSAALQRAHGLIAGRKKTLPCVIMASELAELDGELARLSGERERLLHRLARRMHDAIDSRPQLKSRLRNARAWFKKS